MSERKELLVIKIVDFRDDKDEPAFDVEVYRNRKFQDTTDGVFSTSEYSDQIALKLAKEYAHKHLAQLRL